MGKAYDSVTSNASHNYVRKRVYKLNGLNGWNGALMQPDSVCLEMLLQEIISVHQEVNAKEIPYLYSSSLLGSCLQLSKCGKGELIITCFRPKEGTETSHLQFAYDSLFFVEDDDIVPSNFLIILHLFVLGNQSPAQLKLHVF